MENYTKIEKSCSSCFLRIVGVVFGLIIFCFATLLFYKNEYFLICKQITKEFILKNYVKTAANHIESEKNGKLVLLSGKIATNDILTDPLLRSGVGNCLSLHRRVEMYQWVEKEHKQTRSQGKNTETYYTYSYEKKWSQDYINSSYFNQYKEHLNPSPKYLQYEKRHSLSKNIRIGVHNITSEKFGFLGSPEVLPINYGKVLNLPISAIIKNNSIYYNVFKEEKALIAKELYDKKNENAEEEEDDEAFDLEPYQVNPNKPELGDVKISFVVYPVCAATVLGKQNKDSIVPYKGDGERFNIFQVKAGEVNISDFNEVKEEDESILWKIRVEFYLLMCLGIFILARKGCLFSIFFPFAITAGIMAWFWIPQRYAFGLKALGVMLIGIATSIVILIFKMDSGEQIDFEDNNSIDRKESLNNKNSSDKRDRYAYNFAKPKYDNSNDIGNRDDSSDISNYGNTESSDNNDNYDISHNKDNDSRNSDEYTRNSDEYTRNYNNKDYQ